MGTKKGACDGVPFWRSEEEDNMAEKSKNMNKSSKKNIV